ncbi:single-stranded-DNA-specific exonuclease RecJ [Candidatus Chrysopegis kryptomonas]|uniref:Single-stranded-DNA-specific exonuclease RecJ n=1 Tax=Candidatus Chryseopegocella kryptomonas TaxID=1633643 RepID=A0A0P1NVG3_9BACT|nr:single-stranded-DNA-specific exonuclease RecJ [Candidatus Chrysopegis kryptomonas]CUT03128.1 single-stranded-DNA-specific exonuclease [Candidatus Chrysopegis kryptomonas]
MKNRWKISQVQNQEKILKLSSEVNIPKAIAKVLVARGIDTREKMEKFFNPSLNDLYDPFLMEDMDKAVDRIQRALLNKEKILIYGDYDVDGTTGASMLYLFLKELGANVEVYIPDRFKEGYGISKVGIQRAYEKGASIMIAVDCGITAINEVKFAKNFGIDVIICDHHEPGDVIPDAYAVLDPLKETCQYPFKYLSGCGVAFKLIQALQKKLNVDIDPYQYLDFVAVAASADVVPLVDENRILVKYGLDLLNSSNPRVSFLALLEKAGLKGKKINTWHIGFIIGPRINAVGRLGDATRAVEFLISNDYSSASIWAEELDRENERRQALDRTAFEEAVNMIESNGIFEKDKVFVLYNEKWHQGVIGIVASKIVEKYYRPTILLTYADGVLKGSARSIPNFDIYHALKKCEEMLIQFGGHKHAAGMILHPEKLDDFKIAINKFADEIVNDEMLVREINIDAMVDINEVSESIYEYWRLLKNFEPYGPGNPEPVFLAPNVSISDVKTFGNNHLKFKIKSNGVTVDAVGYGLGDLYGEFSGRERASVVFTFDEGNWNGQQVIQFKVKDLK